MVEPAYLVAFTDWLACACAGRRERAAQAVRAGGQDLVAGVAFAGTAGHVLDYDDTFSEGVAHLSAACAPAALMLAADRGLSIAAALEAYASGFEAMAVVAAASHPALYDGGWHPTAVCGPIGAAVAASRLLSLTPAQSENALAIALLRAGGTRGAFGTDGKAIGVGLAAAAGVQAALIAQAGASVDARAIHGPVGFERVLGACIPAAAARDFPAISRNWIKLHPSCLGTHSPIEAAACAVDRGYVLDERAVDVNVHPVARQAAHLESVGDGLAAKFSIPYCVAHTLMHGPPRVGDFVAVDGEVLEASRRVAVTVDASLPEFGAVLRAGGEEIACVRSPRGSPERPASRSELAEKVADLAGNRLDGVLDDLGAPAAAVAQAAGLVRQRFAGGAAG